MRLYKSEFQLEQEELEGKVKIEVKRIIRNEEYQ